MRRGPGLVCAVGGSAVIGGMLAQRGHQWLAFLLGGFALLVVLLVSLAEIISSPDKPEES